MYFEKNYDRKAMVEMEANPNGYKTEAGSDYADKYVQREKYFAGEILDVTIAYARTEREEKTSNKGGTYYAQKLNLILIDKATNEWFRVRIRGAYLGSDGKEGHNPVKLQDFFELCSMQRPNFLEDADEHSFDYQDRHMWWESYPNMIGLKFKIVIAHTDDFNGYAVNDFEIYDPNGFSFVEKCNGTKQPEDLGVKQLELMNEHNKLYPSEPLNGVVNNPDPVMNDAIETLQEPSLSADDDADLPF